MKDKMDVLIGEQLRNRRLELGYSMEEVGNYLKVSKVTILNYEKGISSMNISTIIKVCGFLRLDYIEVLENAKKEYYNEHTIR